MKCSKCQFKHPESAKFCNECGQNFAPTSKPTTEPLLFDEKLKKIQRYIPEGLTEMILSQKDKIDGERKQVTVMFCDMERVTPLVENQGLEEAYNIMDQEYEIFICKAHNYEGIVNEMTVDETMALFGATVT